MNARTPRATVLALMVGATLGSVSATADAAPKGDQLWRTEEVLQNRMFGTPSFIGGEFRVQAPASDAVAVARAFLNAERSVTGINSPDTELMVMQVLDRDEVGMSHVKFAHMSKGLPVFGSELWVHMKGDVVTSLNGTFLRSVSLPSDARVSGDSAADLAIDHLRFLINAGDADGEFANRESILDLDRESILGYYNGGLTGDAKSTTELAWSVSVSGYQFYISARTGQVLDAYENIHTALKREVYTAKNGTTLPGTLVCSESSGCSSTDKDTKGAWDFFGTTYNYFKNTHSRDSYDNRGALLKGSVHYSTNYQNAYWSGTQMVFGDNFVVEDVTAHELGHAVCQSTANLTYKSQSGALNESYSDVWGVMVDRNDWLMGEDMPIGAIRSFSDPNKYNQPKDMTEYKNMPKFVDNGGVHTNSGIPNYTLYLLSDGGTNQGVTVKAQGRAVAEKIWYRALTTKLTSSSDFAAFGKAANTSCTELFNSGSAECTAMSNALKATKIL